MVTNNWFSKRSNTPTFDETAGSERAKLVTDGGVDTEQSSNDQPSPCEIRIENLGGITEADLTLPPGVSMLVGKNATNRSSLLQSLAAVLGGERSAARLKTDADSGSVELSFDDNTYGRTYTRNGHTVRKDGDTLTDQPDLIDTFVALFADCPARRAVERDEDLRDLLMKPVDTAEIRSKISELTQKRSDLDETIQRANTRKKELPGLEEEKQRLNEELHDVEEEIDALESVVAEIEASADESGESSELRSELESLRSNLSSAERRADEIQQQLEYRRSERDDLLDQRDELQSTIEDFDETVALENTISELESDIQTRKNQRAKLSQAVEDLQSVIQANESILEGNVEQVGFGADESVAAALDPDSQSVECWTCGTTVERATISDQIEALRSIVAQQRTERNELAEQISALETEKREYETTLEEFRNTNRRLDELEARIDQHEEKIQELEADHEEQQTQIDQLAEDISDVEAEIEAVESEESEESDEFVDAHKELTNLERTRGRLENQLEETNQTIEEIEALADEGETAQSQREQVTTEIEHLRGRIETLETELVETLNTAMDELITRLEYDNLSRVWLERKTAKEGNSSFELHIVREASDGSVYEDTAATLSESEREVIGLVVGLAGYLVHDIDKNVPFLLLDSMEMIDGNRLAELLEYIKTETDVEYLSIALLPKDAVSVEESGVFEDHTSIDFEAQTD